MKKKKQGKPGGPGGGTAPPITKNNTAHLDHRLHEIQKVVAETGDDVRELKKAQKTARPKDRSLEVLKRVEATRAALGDAKQELAEKIDALKKRAPRESGDRDAATRALEGVVLGLAAKLDALKQATEAHGAMLEKLLKRPAAGHRKPFAAPAAPNDGEVRRRVVKIEDAVSRIERAIRNQRPAPAPRRRNRDLEGATLAAQRLSAWMWSRVRLRLADSHATKKWALAAPTARRPGKRCELSDEAKDDAHWCAHWTLEPLDAFGTFRIRSADGGGYLSTRPPATKDEAVAGGVAASVVADKDDAHATWRLRPAGVDGLFTLEALRPPKAAPKKKKRKKQQAPDEPPLFLDVRALRQTTGLDSLLVRPSAAPARWQLVQHSLASAPTAAPAPPPSPAAKTPPRPDLSDALKRKTTEAAYWKSKYRDVVSQLETAETEAARGRARRPPPPRGDDSNARSPLPLNPRSPDLDADDDPWSDGRVRPRRAPGGKLTRPPFQKFAPAQGRGTYGLPTTTFR